MFELRLMREIVEDAWSAILARPHLQGFWARAPFPVQGCGMDLPVFSSPEHFLAISLAFRIQVANLVPVDARIEEDLMIIVEMPS